MRPSEALIFELVDLARRRDEKGMRTAIARYAKLQPEDLTTVATSEAYMHSRFDRLDEAIRVVSEVIDSGRDRYEICRRERAALRLQRGDLADALDDIEIALADTSIIAPRFERSLKFQRAFVYAKWGDPRFEAEFRAFPEDYVGRGDTMLTAGDLRTIYKESSGR